MATVQAAYCLFQFYLLGVPRAKGTFASPNHAATFIAAGLAYCYVKAVARSATPSRKGLWLLMGGIGLWALTATGSRSIFVSIGVVLIAYSIILDLGKKYVVAFLMILTVLLAAPSPIRNRILFSKSEDVYSVQRPKIWLHSARVILDFPLFGATLGNFEHVISRYQFPVEHGVGRYTKKFVTADNGFLELAAETGIPGIICMAMVIFVVLREFRKGARGLEDRRRKLLLLGAGAVILVLLSQNLFHKVYRSPPSVWMGMVALSIVLGEKSARGSSQRREHLSSFGEMRTRKVPAIVFHGMALIIGLCVWPFMCLSPYLAFRNYEKATLLQGEGRLEEAEETLRKAISLNRGQAFFFRRMGDIQMERFSLTRSPVLAKSALENFQRAVQLNGISADLWHTLGKYHEFMVSFSTGEQREAHIREAAFAYRKAADLAPTDPFFRVDLAALFIKAGLIEDSIGPLEEALRLEPNFITAQVLLMDMKEKLGHWDEAAVIKANLEQTLKRVSRLKPINSYEARLLMDPARFFKDQG
ncbi:MAG: O-antigen ligase family protein [Thermodesulfobacteriota bacterium]